MKIVNSSQLLTCIGTENDQDICDSSCDYLDGTSILTGHDICLN